jgi:chromosome segregation ATPase
MTLDELHKIEQRLADDVAFYTRPRPSGEGTALPSSVADRQTLLAQLNTANEEIAELQAEVTDTKEANESLQLEVKAQKQFHADAVERLETAESRIAQLDAVLVEIEWLKGENRRVAALNRTNRDENTTLTERVRELERDNIEWQRVTDTETQKAIELEKQLSEARAERDAIEQVVEYWQNAATEPIRGNVANLAELTRLRAIEKAARTFVDVCQVTSREINALRAAIEGSK